MQHKHESTERERAAALTVVNNLVRLMRMSDTLHTAVALSAAAGISRATLIRVLKQHNGVTLAVLAPLAEALRVETWMLLYPNFNPLKPPIIAPKAEPKNIAQTDEQWMSSEELRRWVDKKPRASFEFLK